MEPQDSAPERLQLELPAREQLQIHLLGGFELFENGRPLPRTRTRTEMWILALLALRTNQVIERAWLAATFWPDTGSEQALNNLRRSLSNLRQVLGGEAYRLFSPTSAGITLDMAGAFCDVTAFDAAIARGDMRSLRQAIGLYRGPLLPQCEAEWLTEERDRRAEAYVQALESLAAHCQREGRRQETVEFLREALRIDPFRENTQCALMEALAAQGDRAAATFAYRQFRLLLHDQLQSEPAAETKALYVRLREERGWKRNEEIAAPSPPAPVPHVENAFPLHIPRPLSELVGRKEEIVKVQALLSESRMVTLTGIGGVGKTRLALEVALHSTSRYPDGIWFVDLAPVTQEALVVHAVAESLGLREEAGQSHIEALMRFIAEKELLLLLDNCEHLLDACAPVVMTLLQNGPRLHVLATSRQALKVSGERAWDVPPLFLPDRGDAEEREAPESLLGWPATRLFVERAIDASASFLLTGQNAHSIADICRRLDGIPLAIELAAARVKVLSPAEIHTRLDRGLRLLTGGLRTALPRQQTLRALFDWSYDLLTPPEQRLLNALSVFSGGWTLAAAEYLAAGESEPGERIEDWEVLDLLSSLADKSLLFTRTQGADTRYHLLETVRQYASERLRESGADRGVRVRHSEYFLALAEEIKPKLRGAEQVHWIEVLEQEHDNLRQAFAWYEESAAEAQAVEKGLRLGAALERFWETRGHFSEGRKQLSGFLSVPGGQPRTTARAEALICLGGLVQAQGDYSLARKFFEESREIARELGEPRLLAPSLIGLGMLASKEGDHALAHSLYEESLKLYREMADRGGIALSLAYLANVASQHGDYAGARVFLEEGLPIARETGDRKILALSLLILGSVANEQGEDAEARVFYEESLAIQREWGNRRGMAHVLHNLAVLTRRQGDYAAARTLYEQNLKIGRALGDKYLVASTLLNLGSMTSRQGHLEEARAFYEESLRINRETGDRKLIALILYNLHIVAEKQGEPERAYRLLEESLTIAAEIEYRLLIASGLETMASSAACEGQTERGVILWSAASVLREAIGSPLAPDLAQKLEQDLGEAEQNLGRAGFASAWALGRTMPLEQATEYALARP